MTVEILAGVSCCHTNLSKLAEWSAGWQSRALLGCGVCAAQMQHGTVKGNLREGALSECECNTGWVTCAGFEQAVWIAPVPADVSSLCTLPVLASVSLLVQCSFCCYMLRGLYWGCLRCTTCEFIIHELAVVEGVLTCFPFSEGWFLHLLVFKSAHTCGWCKRWDECFSPESGGKLRYQSCSS